MGEPRNHPEQVVMTDTKSLLSVSSTLIYVAPHDPTALYDLSQNAVPEPELYVPAAHAWHTAENISPLPVL